MTLDQAARVRPGQEVFITTVLLDRDDTIVAVDRGNLGDVKGYRASFTLPVQSRGQVNHRDLHLTLGQALDYIESEITKHLARGHGALAKLDRLRQCVG